MDYNYLAESLAALAGVPVRIYRDGRFLSLHLPSAELFADPMHHPIFH